MIVDGQQVVRLPHNGWHPRDYQLGLWSYLANGGKRAVAVCHRRWGKDDLALHWTATALAQRPAVYWHMLPEAAQARKAIWTAVNPHTGIRRIDEAFPHELRASTNENEMFIRFRNGALWQVVGSDNYNSLVGSPPVGLIMSEWAIANPGAWAYLRPILLENGGWAVFIYTARGRNHGFRTFQLATTDPEWYGVRQTARDTGVFTEDQLASELREYINDYGEEDGTALFEQEYLCSFESAIVGAYYGRTMARLDQEGRITNVPHDPNRPVYTSWDLGLDDATVVWFFQIVGREIRVIDVYECRNRGLDQIARDLIAKPYTYGEHYLPHDIEVRELTHARTRREVLSGLGIKPIITGKQRDKSERITAVRMTLPMCVFDQTKCARGLEALRGYRVDYDEKNRTPKATPYKDWTGHFADAFGELAMQVRATGAGNRQVVADGEFDPFKASLGGYHSDRNRVLNPVPNLTWKPETRQESTSDYDPFAVNEVDYR